MGFVSLICAALALTSTLSSVSGATLRYDVPPSVRKEIMGLRNEGKKDFIWNIF